MAARMRSIMLLIASLVLAGCEEGAGAPASIAQDEAGSVENAVPPRGGDRVAGRWRHGAMAEWEMKAARRRSRR